ISTKQDIDVAMKLGTNYPYGPFEWSEKIGLKKIYNLLQRLEQQDATYSPCSLLKQEAQA
ncbi:MAG: 3-hydroxyacyl-CoA dehydrogenase family protein, partial [Chitinophagaceae bacterium]